MNVIADGVYVSDTFISFFSSSNNFEKKSHHCYGTTFNGKDDFHWLIDFNGMTTQMDLFCA